MLLLLMLLMLLMLLLQRAAPPHLKTGCIVFSSQPCVAPVLAHSLCHVPHRMSYFGKDSGFMHGCVTGSRPVACTCRKLSVR